MNTNKIESAYIHIPFCKKICSYCDFCKMYYNEKMVVEYLEKLSEEINQTYKYETLKTLYIGGGTPSSLKLKEIERLFEILKIFKLKKEYEFTFECNIEDISKDLLIMLKENRINRLSIGVQTFNKNFIKYLNRNHTKKMVFEKIKLCKEIGFKNISIDIIYGLKNQTLNDIKKEIELFLKLDIDHISTYSLILEKHTKLYINKEKNINEDLEYEMYNYISKELKNSGFEKYEISNFAKNKKYSKHNLNYWNNNEYYGFGLSSSGYINNYRYENTRSINKYLENCFKKENIYINKEEKMYEEVMLNLRKKDGINLSSFYKKFNIEFEKKYNIKELLLNKELIKNNGNIYINDKYIYLMNEIINKII